MRNIHTIYIGILSFLLVQNSALSQCITNGISTNPDFPINNQLPSKKNLYFDWRLSNYSNNSTCQLLTQIESPFYKIDNLEILRASKDMMPEDGWELIRREFGYTDANTTKPESPEHTYLILYNKYTGILRILLKTCRMADYTGAKITLKFDATTTFQSALMDFTSSIRALDQTHISSPKAQSFSPFVNDRTKWFYADFPIAYDPCTCNYKSKINILSHLIQDSQISLSGSLSGSITSITSGQGSVMNDGSYSFKDFSNDADKFKKLYGNVDNFISETRNVVNTIPNSSSVSNALTNFQNGLKDNQFLKTGLAAVPWLGAAVGILDFFSGGGKASPQQVQIMPLAANLSLKLGGTMYTSNQYHSITFSTPGSLEASLDPDIYPFYNEVLGVFNLLNGPKFSRYNELIELKNSSYRWKRIVAYKLNSPIKWVLNPASGLDLQDAQVAYVALSNNSSSTPPATIGQGFSILEGKDAVSGKWEYRTEYVNINCLGNDHKFEWIDYSIASTAPTTFYMKIILNFKNISNPAAQNTLVVLKYPILLLPSGSLTGSAFNPTACLGGRFIKATSSEIVTFCTSSIYTQNRNNPGTRKSTPSSEDPISSEIYPNPANNILTIDGSKISKGIATVQIFDFNGIVVYSSSSFNFNNESESIDVSTFNDGIYLVKIMYRDGKQSTQRIVIKH